MNSEIIEYDQSRFDAGYYGGGERGGFRDYRYDSSDQRKELAKKLDAIIRHTGQPGKILFIGCAKGFEVRRFQEAGFDAYGVDISAYAIANCESEAKERCSLYNGFDLDKFGDKSMDTVAAFDVLTLIPDDMMTKLASEIQRVSLRWIIFRTIVKEWRNLSDSLDGVDGVTFKYRTVDGWCELFEKGDLFRLDQALIDGFNRETMFYFKRL